MVQPVGGLRAAACVSKKLKRHVAARSDLAKLPEGRHKEAIQNRAYRKTCVPAEVSASVATRRLVRRCARVDISSSAAENAERMQSPTRYLGMSRTDAREQTLPTMAACRED